jgi:two-component system, OmpR family, response regulator
VVEEEVLIAKEIGSELTRLGYATRLAQDEEDGVRLALSDEPAIVILDRMLGARDGLAIVETMRERGIATPVLVISALSTPVERIRGLRAGADDYLSKPFAMDELIARVEALIRRLGDRRTSRLRVGSLEIDLIEKTAWRDGRFLDLTPREFKVLEYFMRHPDQVVSRATLLTEVWNHDTPRLTNMVDVQIGSLRRKLDADVERPFIVNVRGEGFILRSDVRD